MQIDLFNFKELIDINHLQEVTNPILFQRGDIPHPQGLVSNEIFGITTRSRKETFAYINLQGYFFHPHVYKALKRLFRNVERIVNGELFYVINDEGILVLDNQKGETGIEFLYNNWEKIKWKYSIDPGMRNERIDLLTKTPKDEIFTHYCLVIPPFYRDIMNGKNGGGETSDINTYYTKLIRAASLIKERDMFDFQFHATNYNIQNTMISVYDYFKEKLEKKQGLLRKYLLGRNVDYCTRTVITAPNFHANKPSESMIDFKHAGVPISQICSLCYPFIIQWLKSFFEREVFDNKNGKVFYNPVTDQIESIEKLDNPESYFNEKFFKKKIDAFIKDPESRFDKIEIPVNGNKKLYLRFTGKRLDSSNTSEISGLAFRPMSWTDILYMACEDTVKDKHCMVTRYPLLDEFGIFFANIRVLSTTETDVVSFNGKIYKWYPHVDYTVPTELIGSKFIDSTQFSNSYLPGLDGDYDGDQTTIKIIYTQEANAEIERAMTSKSYFINASGQNIRYVENEVVQTMYTLTKEPDKNAKSLSEIDKKFFLSLTPDDITFDNLVSWFADLTDISKSKTAEAKSKFNPTDKMTLTHKDYPMVKGTIETTLGRFIYTKLIVEGCGLDNVLGFVNLQLDDSGHGKVENAITAGLIQDLITVPQMYKYTDTRDWLGLQLHSVITTSFTLNSIIVPKEVKALKNELFKKYKKELEEGNEVIAAQIEKQLVAKTKEVLKGDIGLDLYMSGARGSIGNNYKNMFLTRGAMKDTATGKYKVVEHSLMDGLQKKDITSHSNAIVAGSYPKAVGTAVSGYLAKELLSALQTETLAEEGSDCGTKGTIEITIPAKKTNDFMYRYIIENGKEKCLTPDILNSYIGKTVRMRSPLFCIGVGPTKHLCNKCAGDFYYKLGKKDIGLLCSRPAETTKRLGMKKFHTQVIELTQINPDDMLV